MPHSAFLLVFTLVGAGVSVADLGLDGLPDQCRRPNLATSLPLSEGGLSIGATLPPSDVVPPFDVVEPTLWSAWWEFNKEPYLAIKEAIHGQDTVSFGRDGFFLGRGQRDLSASPLRPTPDQIFGRIVPALVEVLELERNDDLVAAALVALGKIGEHRPTIDSSATFSTGVDVENAIRRHIGHKNIHVAEKAVLALGVFGSDRSVVSLADLLQDRPAGRHAVGSAHVSERMRSFAAYSLGLIGNRTKNEDIRLYIAWSLVRTLEDWRSGPRDLPVASVSALGIVALPMAGDSPPTTGSPFFYSRHQQIRWLLDYFGDRSNNFLARAHVPTALGRLLHGVPEDSELRTEVAVACMDALEHRSRPHREIKQSSALALGVIGDADQDQLDRRITRTLRRVAADAGDETVRHFALIALAQVASRPGSGAGDPLATTPDVRRFLLSNLNRGRSADRPWIAVALGVMGRGLAEAKTVSSRDSAQALHESLARARSTRDIGAYSIGIGLHGATNASGELLRVLGEKGDDFTRGYAAVGLGLLRASGTSEGLRRTIQSARFRPELLSRAAIGMALIGDKSVDSLLEKMLEDSNTLASQTSIAFALGRIGDSRSIEPLLDLLQDERNTDGARSVAALALGIAAEKDPLPWRTLYSVNVNYLAATPTLTGACGILDTL